MRDKENRGGAPPQPHDGPKALAIADTRATMAEKAKAEARD